jgi:hypothetical protein
VSENEKRVCYFSNIMRTTYAYAFMTMALEVKHGSDSYRFNIREIEYEKEDIEISYVIGISKQIYTHNYAYECPSFREHALKHLSK